MHLDIDLPVTSPHHQVCRGTNLTVCGVDVPDRLAQRALILGFKERVDHLQFYAPVNILWHDSPSLWVGAGEEATSCKIICSIFNTKYKETTTNSHDSYMVCLAMVSLQTWYFDLTHSTTNVQFHWRLVIRAVEAQRRPRSSCNHASNLRGQGMPRNQS